MGIYFRSFFVRVFIILLLCLTPLAVQSSDDAEMDEVYKTTQLFLDAIFSGDTDTIKSNIAGDLGNRLQTLLSNNTAYPNVLKEKYANASYQIDDPAMDGSNASINVTVEFSDSQTRSYRIELTKTNSLKWMVTEQVELP